MIMEYHNIGFVIYKIEDVILKNRIMLAPLSNYWGGGGPGPLAPGPPLPTPIYSAAMRPKDVDRMAKSIDPGYTALFWICNIKFPTVYNLNEYCQMFTTFPFIYLFIYLFNFFTIRGVENRQLFYKFFGSFITMQSFVIAKFS